MRAMCSDFSSPIRFQLFPADRVAIERQVENQHIHARLAEQTQVTPLGLCIHHGLDALGAYVASGRHSCHLPGGSLRTDVRIESTA